MAESQVLTQTSLIDFFGPEFQRINNQVDIKEDIIYSTQNELNKIFSGTFFIERRISKSRCPKCKTHRIKKLTTIERYVHRFLGIVEHVEIGRYSCSRCNHTFSAKYDEAPPKSIFHYELIKFSIDLCTRFNESLRGTETILKDHLKVEVSHTVILDWIQKAAKAVEEIRFKLIPPFSGYLAIDEREIKISGEKYYVLGYADAKLGSFLYYDIVSSKTKKSYEESIFRFLHETDLESQIIAVITDEFSTFISVIPEIFKNCIHSYCIFHVRRNIYKRVHSAAKISLRKKLPKEFQDITSILNEIFRVRDQAHAKYWLYVARAAQIRCNLDSNQNITDLINDLENKLEHITYFIKNPESPKTTNSCEQIWSKITPRLEIMKNFNSLKSVKSYLNLLQTIINFEKYKKWCKKHPRDADKLSFKINVDHWFEYIKFNE